MCAIQSAQQPHCGSFQTSTAVSARAASFAGGVGEIGAWQAMIPETGAVEIARLAPLAVRAGELARLAVETGKVVLFDPETETRID